MLAFVHGRANRVTRVEHKNDGHAEDPDESQHDHNISRLHFLHLLGVLVDKPLIRHLEPVFVMSVVRRCAPKTRAVATLQVSAPHEWHVYSRTMSPHPINLRLQPSHVQTAHEQAGEDGKRGDRARDHRRVYLCENRERHNDGAGHCVPEVADAVPEPLDPRQMYSSTGTLSLSHRCMSDCNTRCEKGRLGVTYTK